MFAAKICAVAFIFQLPFTFAGCSAAAGIALKHHVGAFNQRVGQIANNHGFKCNFFIKSICSCILNKRNQCFFLIQFLQTP